MARFLDSMRVGTKLTLIALAYTVPIGILLLLLVREQNIAIDFATREREGGRYLRPLVNALSALSTRASRAHVTELESARVGTELSELAAIDSELNASLQTNLSGLTSKGRSQLSVSSLQREWDKLKTSTDAAREPAVAASVTNLRSLVAQIGDTSNLILDPDLDTYYTMDATLIRVPEALDILPQLTAGLRKPELTDADKRQLIALLASLRANRAATKDSFERAFTETANFGQSARLKPSLAPLLSAYLDKTEAYFSAVDAVLAGELDHSKALASSRDVGHAA